MTMASCSFVCKTTATQTPLDRNRFAALVLLLQRAPEHQGCCGSNECAVACRQLPRRVVRMNLVDYLKERARQLRLEAEASDARLKQQKIEAANAFERLATLTILRRRGKAIVSPPASRDD